MEMIAALATASYFALMNVKRGCTTAPGGDVDVMPREGEIVD